MTPDPIDVHIGRRIRGRRRLLDIPQREVADLCGTTFQQIHKYEVAANRVMPAKLLRLARALEVEVSYFFEGFDEGSLV